MVGPLCIAAVVIGERDSEKLRKMGVKDSKKLSRREREKLEDRIKKTVEDFALVRIPAAKIDELRKRKSLNRIELEKMADLIDALRPDRVIVDATEVKTEKIEREMLAELPGDLSNKLKLKAENFADDNYPVVSAASILAKLARDDSVCELEEKLGREIGNGYPSDQRTVDFLKDVLERDGTYPDCVRKSWITAERLVKEREQDGLSEFC